MLTTRNGFPFAEGFNRIVQGDRGAYVEFETDHIIQANVQMPEDSKFRITPNWIKKVYYFEYRTKDSCNVKLYYQRKLVSYADYKVGKWYVALQDVEHCLKEEEWNWPWIGAYWNPNDINSLPA